MKVAHLILTYTNPKLTERLIKRLNQPEFTFYVHVDKKLSIEPYLYLRKYTNVFLIHNREDVRWAGFNTIKATFKCIQEIAATEVKYDYINFISGQDYPIKSGKYMLEFFKKNKGKQFIEYASIEDQWIEALPRITNYHFANFTFRGRYRLEKIINFFLPKRELPDNLKPYGKSMFWMLTMDCALYVVDFFREHKELARFFLFTWGSDEFAFQTVLMNSHYKDSVVNNDFRYIDWSQGGAHPKILTEADLPKIKASNDLFARKFDENMSDEFMDTLDSLN
ncbi:beta-1,6-N-acetylglucosaminyltransferase [Mucilaginibacter ginkgonis]|uniref:Peptide O-xylosyltransferase n=1 Tax=Mucilaginibacter ginkgonis TaxID=2682091 RepID=A0A6I4I504_9SPHI|nr:beta-1,6-N-acetylglucosaminyltransferase [Mucilaginibacter ginkgonis]QQL48291.1 glycosyl transferase [Mucilaginibacter ginkgonis]